MKSYNIKYLIFSLLNFFIFCNTLSATELSGYINSDSTLSLSKSPYNLNGDLYIRNGATLTIEAGVTINFPSGSYQIFVGSHVSSVGTLNADNVQFIGYASNTGDYIDIREGSTANITNCNFQDIYLRVDKSSPTLSSSTGDNFYITMTEASPTIQNMVFNNSTYCLEFINECSPTLSNLSFNNVTHPGIYFQGTVNSNWTLNNYGIPYYLSRDLYINTNSTLTIASSTTINYLSSGNEIYVGSSINSLGTLTAENVTFNGYLNDSNDDELYFQYGSSSSLDGCSFNNVYLNLTNASPAIENCTFSDVNYPLLFRDECSPTLNNVTFSEDVTNVGIQFYGTVNSDWTLPNYGWPYYLAGDLYINTGATFTIASGDSIFFPSGSYQIFVGSHVSSVGTLNADNVQFIGYASNTGDYIDIREGSTANITNCNFQDIYLRVDKSSPTLSSSTGDNFYITMTEASPTIQNMVFNNSTYCLEFINECSPTLSNLSFNNVTHPGIYLQGTVNSNWTLNNYGIPYYLSRDLYINTNSTLTIASSTTINYLSSGNEIYVGSSINSLGTLTAENVTFNGYLNDSNDDELYFQYGSSSSLDGCTFNNIYLNLTNASPTIENCTFSDVNYPILFRDECSPTLSNVTFSEDVTNVGIQFYGTVNSDWTLPNYGWPYYLAGDLYINTGATLTIASGDSIFFPSGSYQIFVGSHVSSVGTLNADNVQFIGYASNTGDYIDIREGSTANITNCNFQDIYLRVDKSSPTLSSSTGDNFYITMTEASPTIQNMVFNNSTYCLEFINECSPTLSNLSFNNVTHPGIYFQGTVNSNWTLNNYGIPYYLSRDLYINTNSTLTIASSTTINYLSSGNEIYVGSSINSLGTLTAENVTFNGYLNDSNDDELYFQYGSSSSLDGCTFNNIYLNLTNASPTIENCTFSDVNYPILFRDECSPTLSNVTFSEDVTNVGIQFYGTVNSDWTLPNYGWPYYLAGDLYINTGATLTVASGDSIFFPSSSYEIFVGNSNSSKGILNATNVYFSGTDNFDDEIYFRYGSTGKLNGCAFEAIKLYLDNASPSISNSQFFRSTNSVYLRNNANPSILNNDFFNNSIAVKNESNLIVEAKNNFWGHSSGPYHPNNLGGLGEMIEGNVNFTPFSTSSISGSTDGELLAKSLSFNGIAVGSVGDLLVNLTSLDKVDLLVTDIQSDDQAFSVESSKRFWVKQGDTVATTIRFSPKSSIEYSANLTFYTNDPAQSIITIPMNGIGVPTLAVNKKELKFGEVDVNKFAKDSFWIKNIGTASIMVDSVVSTNARFSLSLQTSQQPLQEFLYNELIDPEPAASFEAKESAISNAGLSRFRLNRGDSTEIFVTFRPNRRATELGTINIHYDNTGIEQVNISGEGVADPVSVTISSINHQSFPFIYMNVVVDTFAFGMSDLKQSNFQVFENNDIQTDYFLVTPPGESGGSRLTDIVFIMDNSGSMGDEQLQIENNVSDFVNTLSGSGIDFALGLCRYGQGSGGGAPLFEDNGSLTTDAEYFKNNVWKRNTVSGGTEPGYRAIKESAGGFAFRPGTQKIFIIITDEPPNQGGATLQETIDACVDNSITVFALTNYALFTAFTPITDVTNGEVYDILANFDEILEYISTLISNTYVVQYQSSNPVADGIDRNVEVEVTYKGNSDSDTISYLPGEAPDIIRTKNTLGLHNQAWAENTSFTIEVEIIDNTPPDLKSATLYYRTTGGTSYKAVAMSLVRGNTYQGLIPGGEVVTPGLDYYISATDGQNTATDPSNDAVNNPYQIAILPNEAPEIIHKPIIYSIIAEPVLIEAEVTDVTNTLNEVQLYYRKIGQLVYTDTPMVKADGDIYRFTIPNEYLTEAGLEYFIRATDDFKVSSTNGTYDEPYQVFVQSYNPGTTIIVHGLDFLGLFGDRNLNEHAQWTLTLARAIAKRIGNGQVYTLANGILQYRDDYSVGHDGEKIIVFDWLDESDRATFGYSEGAGDALAALLIQYSEEGYFSLDQLHFIGHSRGSVVCSEAIQRLSLYRDNSNLSVDGNIHFTTLDPHPWDERKGDEIGDPGWASDHDVNGKEINFGVIAWDIVSYVDNYWHKGGGIDLNGLPSFPGCLNNKNLSETENYYKNMNHGGIHTWYHGTVDFESETNEVDDDPRIINPEDTWYPRTERKSLGFNYTSSIGGDLSSIQSQNTVSIYDDETFGITTIFNGDFSKNGYWWNMTYWIPGWEAHNGGGKGFINLDYANYRLKLNDNNESRIHNSLFIPQGMEGIYFRYRVSNKSNDDRLVVKLNDEKLDQEFPLDDRSLTYINTSVGIQGYAGTVNTLSFQIESKDEKVNSTVYIDDISFQILRYFSASVASPVNLHTYDSKGNHTGPTSDSTWVTEIPNSKYMVIGDGTEHPIKSIILPPIIDSDEYTFRIESLDTTASFGFYLEDNSDTSKTSVVTFDNVPIEPKTIVTTTINKLSPNITLSLDKEGDGNFESIVEADNYFENINIFSSYEGNGTIDPLGEILVNYGDSLTVNILPDSGHAISDVFVDNESIGSVASYTFSNIVTEHTVHAIFSQPTGIIDNGHVPKIFSLAQNYPNPFNISTNIKISIPKDEFVEITLYNINGQKLSTILGKQMNAGNHELTFDGNNLSSGIYFYKIKAGAFIQTKKMVLIK